MTIHVLLLCGGRSAEHEVSLQSAASVIRHLDRSRYRISVIGISKQGGVYDSSELRTVLDLGGEKELELPATDNWVSHLAARPPDIVFPVLHGPYGEDGTVQGLFEVLDLPFVGAGVCGSALGMNKIHCKQVLLNAGLPVLPFRTVDSLSWRDQNRIVQAIQEQLAYPLFVKPANMGSSVGINKSKSTEELRRHIDIAFQYDDRVVVEQGIEARDVETSVLGNLEPIVSTVGEIIPSREFYSYEAKYLDDSSELLIPAPLTGRQAERVRELARQAYLALQLEGMARVDFLVDKQSGEIWINEPNTIPGFTRISMYPKLWEASGLSYPRLLDRLIELGLERRRRRSRFSVDRDLP